jgi:hypothetical protein
VRPSADRWLDPRREAELHELLVPLPASELNAYEVSALVNSSKRLAGMREAGGVGWSNLDASNRTGSGRFTLIEIAS